MPVKLRLRRQGRKKAAHFSIVAADARAPRDGRYIQKIGFYNPIPVPARVYLDHDAAIKWLSNGAQPTHTVRALLRHGGITLKYALIKQGKSEEEIEKIFSKWRSEKDSKKKKKVIMVDVHDRPLEETGEVAAPKSYNAPPPPKEEEEVVEEVEQAEEAAAEAVEEAVAEGEAAAEEATEEQAAETAEEEKAEEAAPEEAETAEKTE